MNSADRIRAYLETRSAVGPDGIGRIGRMEHTVAAHQAADGSWVTLEEADLEVVLQMLDLLARVAAGPAFPAMPARERDPAYYLFMAERQVRGQR